jgi:hypothetical protein
MDATIERLVRAEELNREAAVLAGRAEEIDRRAATGNATDLDLAILDGIRERMDEIISELRELRAAQRDERPKQDAKSKLGTTREKGVAGFYSAAVIAGVFAALWYFLA